MRGMPYDYPLLKFEKPMLVSSNVEMLYRWSESLYCSKILFAWVFHWVCFVLALVVNQVLPKNLLNNCNKKKSHN